MMADTNIVIDLRDESRWYDWSADRIARAPSGQVFVSAVVVGEVASRGGTEQEIRDMLVGFGILPISLDAAAGYRAGLAHRAYRQAGGTRGSLLADFLIGAHAVIERLPLLTRDPRGYRTYFPELELITPESHP